MPVYSSGSRRPGRPSRAFRLAYFDARPRAGIQAVYRVECNVRRGGWRKGRVVKHWYWEPGMPPGHFMPYQIELESGCLIFARHDDDRSIRRAIDYGDSKIN